MLNQPYYMRKKMKQKFPKRKQEPTPRSLGADLGRFISRKRVKCSQIKGEEPTGREDSKWSQLPKEIMELILKQLILSDYIRFGAVCVSWRSVATEKRYPPVPQLPWIMLSKCSKSEIRAFYSPSEDRIYKLNLPEIRATQCRGSYKGWMIMSEVNGRNYLLNMFSREQIQLPSRPRHQSSNTGSYISKAILSSAPTSDHTAISENCVVVAITEQVLVFCRLGDKKWTAFEEWNGITWGSRFYKDIAFCNGLLYAVNVKQELITCAFGPPLKVCNAIVPREDIYNGQANLVESCGELFTVGRTWDNGFQYLRYGLFKLDASVPQWVEIKSSFDEDPLFWRSFSSTTKFLGCWRSCIYFIHKNNVDGSEIMFCHLGNGSIERCLPMNRPSLRITDTWVTSDSW
ncbi:putative F-box protein At1g65740 [Tasmannia lanceolata]|uniref:putative F-box protein At1g65740 n=1 Tax=Tasmannia lanceolata TaxID=3420 RepID=UPI004062EEB1